MVSQSCQQRSAEVAAQSVLQKNMSVPTLRVEEAYGSRFLTHDLRVLKPPALLALHPEYYAKSLRLSFGKTHISVQSSESDSLISRCQLSDPNLQTLGMT